MSAVRTLSMPCQVVLQAAHSAVSALIRNRSASSIRRLPSSKGVLTQVSPHDGQGTRSGTMVSSSALMASRQPVSLVVA